MNAVRRLVTTLVCASAAGLAQASTPFQVEEATITDIQAALLNRQITTVELVQKYLARIQAYDGTCVRQPEGLLGPIETIPNAGQLNSLGTINLRPKARKAWKLDDRKARSLTDLKDDDPSMPDALETAAAQDEQLARTGKLVGPLHGVVLSVKDQFDTFDMRTTNGADVAYANDRPPRDATFIARLRAAGAIILAKANRGNSQPRSAFGGVVCNPYDTERTPRASSSGSAVSVSANLVTCSIGEETGISIRGPAAATNTVGLAPTQELVSRGGMSGPGISVRPGPICRTVEDTARLLSVVTGYDPRDPLTAFSVGRIPEQPYESFAQGGRLDGVRIGVVREFMNRKLFTKADEPAIEIVERALGDLQRLGATIVDPGPEGALFQDCFRKYGPQAFGKLFTRRYPELFPVDSHGNPIGDHIAKLAELVDNPHLVPDGFSIRDIGTVVALGDSAYWRTRYLRERGDSAIRTLEQLNAATKRIYDPEYQSVRVILHLGPADQREVDMADRMLQRHAFQQVVLQCMAELQLDALTYPTMNIPPLKIQAPEEPPVNGRVVYHWTIFGQHGFPMLSVPAGFTTHVYDRVRDPSAESGTRLVGPVPARLPVGIDFTARPFAEPILFRIGSAYERTTRHRSPPPAFTRSPPASPRQSSH